MSGEAIFSRKAGGYHCRILDRLCGLWTRTRDRLGRGAAAPREASTDSGRSLGRPRTPQDADIEQGTPLNDRDGLLSDREGSEAGPSQAHLPVGDTPAASPSASPRSSGDEGRSVGGSGGGRANLSASRLVREAEERRQAQLQRERDARQVGSQGTRTAGVSKRDWR